LQIVVLHVKHDVSITKYQKEELKQKNNNIPFLEIDLAESIFVRLKIVAKNVYLCSLLST
jgi:hypothetical protein